MVINWYGQACFKLQSGKQTVFIDPFKKELGLKPPRGEANLVLITHEHFDHNNPGAVKGDPFVIDGPGEYEYQGIRVDGIFSYHDDKEGAERGTNTLYRIKMEDMIIAHLGDIGQKQLSDKQLEQLGEVDILMVPVGGTFTVAAQGAVEIVNQVQPRIVVPMHYKIKGIKPKLAPVDGFLEEVGKKDITPQDKLTLKQKDLPGVDEPMEVAVLKV